MTENEPHEASDDPPNRAAVSDGDVAALEAELTERGEPYARVTIVRREPPVSANVGDRAVVTADGELRGWIGGAACAQTTAISEAKAAIEDGKPRFVGIAPDPEEIDRPGLEAFPMHCHSEGVLELFIEPVNPTPDLLIVGDSPVARALTRLADELAVDVVLVDPDAGDDHAADRLVTSTDPETVVDAVGRSPLVVVASMGKYDARGVAAGVAADASYVGLVASETRSGEVIERAATLLETDPERVRAAVTNPAGVDIEAYTPAEIAVSILAEVVDARAAGAAGSPQQSPADAKTSSPADGNAETERGAAVEEASENDAAEDGASEGDTARDVASGRDAAEDETATADLATDPVCGMTADPETAPSVDHDGETYYFCCEGCADSFRAEPESYLERGEAA
ncbi:XdhC family protein [Halobellus rarus]|uniref:XdhC family protein n=1 Tax=Halobellus rarus TaxID=1126237 RepID=A0ABD6CND2_9EURY|nr:XdhC family protein [Halobellus rarus]